MEHYARQTWTFNNRRNTLFNFEKWRFFEANTYIAFSAKISLETPRKHTRGSYPGRSGRRN